jgi:glutamine synthetase
MNYTKEEVIEYAREEDVKFIRLAFCGVFGRQKNISIMPDELPRAFTHGIAIDASAIAGFGDESRSDLFLHPDPETLSPLPWRPEHGRVMQMFSAITWPDGTPFACDTRALLKKAVADAKEAGLEFSFGAEQEFYLFRLDENGNPTKIPYDNAGYMDVAPYDRGENIRREICLTLEQMGIRPESSHHEVGPGQNEIDIRYSDPLTAADNVMMFRRVVKTVAERNGLYADFSPKPLEQEPGNGFHINISLKNKSGEEYVCPMLAGILKHVKAMSVFLNPTDDSYRRLGKSKAPSYISWSFENRSQLIRIPAAQGEFQRAELRSPDTAANPYLAFALLIYACVEGIRDNLELAPATNINFYTADAASLTKYDRLPDNLADARRLAEESDFIREHIPAEILDLYCERG